MSDLEPNSRLDQFEVTGLLAKSGMATVYRARDRSSGQDVVLKVPHLEYASDIVFHERFRREEEIGLKLDHPGVVRIIAPESKSRLYLAMEFVAGESLRDRLKREGRLSIEEAVRIGIAIADILEYLHCAGIVHRDLKPENTMLLADGSIKLLDFGIALDSSRRALEWKGLSQSVGTPDYMAPEQTHGNPGDARSDLYSLGVILYEMLAGHVPVSQPPPPLALERPEVPPALGQIVMQALAESPSRRPQRALELRDSLAHPQSVVSNAGVRRSARRPQLALTVGAVVVYVLLMIVLSRIGASH
ncbi:MAG TPA: serine/threonine-protein kinase [Candidatus Binatia bacterium]|jgi:serine/threonine-protein kinase